LRRRITGTEGLTRVPKVLFVCHNHPSIRPGGVETYALELCSGMRAAGDFEPLLLARVRDPKAVSVITRASKASSEYFFHNDHAGYDALYGTCSDKSFVTRHFREFLEEHAPDVVHFHHTLFLGYDLIRQTRNTLPSAPICYTLHEYVPICHHNGQMVRTFDGTPCEKASPDRCHECFPDVSAQSFFMRKRFIESHFQLVDRFFSPSHFLRDRYVDWGIPASRIQYEEYGRRQATQARAARRVTAGMRNRFAFFGQFTSFKGVDVLLRAMALVGGEARLFLHGSNLEFQSKAFQHEFRALVQATKANVKFVGAYKPEQIPRLMAGVDWVVVPSIWWENSPLVIQEAFMHRRPVICSDIGAMAEKVTDGVSGLHFRAGDAQSLAKTLRRAARSPALWNKLRNGIPPVHRMDDHVRTLAGVYRRLLLDAATKA
jgi:glycosyltransferase involved in cell wall biosynthesis